MHNFLTIRVAQTSFYVQLKVVKMQFFLQIDGYKTHKKYDVNGLSIVSVTASSVSNINSKLIKLFHKQFSLIFKNLAFY